MAGICPMPDHPICVVECSLMARRVVSGFFAAVLLLWAPALQADNANRDPHSMDRFFDAAARNDVALLKQKIDAGTPVDARNTEGRTALLLATRANAIEAARFLIDLGADVNAKDKIEDTPYLYAGAEGRLEILKMTVEAGADLTDTNRYGGTATDQNICQ